MGFFAIIVLVGLIITAIKVAESMMSRPSLPDGVGGDERIRALEVELRANEMRLSQTEEQVADLGEKLRFLEAVLAKPLPPVEIPATTRNEDER